MFNKDLFMSLCKKYDVELSKTARSPMIEDGESFREITNVDIERIFVHSQTY